MRIIKIANDRDDINDFNQRLISDSAFEQKFRDHLAVDPSQVFGVSRPLRDKYLPIAIESMMSLCRMNPYKWIGRAVKLFPDHMNQFKEEAMARIEKDIEIEPNVQLYERVVDIMPDKIVKINILFFKSLSKKIQEDPDKYYYEAIQVLPDWDFNDAYSKSKLRKTPTEQTAQQPKQPSNWWQRSKDGIGNIIDK